MHTPCSVSNVECRVSRQGAQGKVSAQGCAGPEKPLRVEISANGNGLGKSCRREDRAACLP